MGGDGGSGASGVFKLLVTNTDVIVGPLVSLLYPLYASIRAIESRSAVDDQQWLTYWVLYSMITLFELTFSSVIEWFPLWSYLKLIFTCWLVIPHFSGAAFVYEHYVRPYIVTRQKSVNFWYVPRKKDVFGKSDNILSQAEKYIHENGSRAYDKIMHKSKKATPSHAFHSEGYDDDHRYGEHRYIDEQRYEDEYRYTN